MIAANNQFHLMVQVATSIVVRLKSRTFYMKSAPKNCVCKVKKKSTDHAVHAGHGVLQRPLWVTNSLVDRNMEEWEWIQIHIDVDTFWY